MFAVLAAALVITGVNYVANEGVKAAYGSEVEAENRNELDIDVTYASDEFTNSVNPSITITNNSDKELKLEDLNLKYFGVCEEGKDTVADIYYSGIKNGDYQDFTSNIKACVKQSDDEYDKHLEINFDGGSLKAGESMIIQMGIHNNDWTRFKNIDKAQISISGYESGNLVYGEEKFKGRQEEKVTMSFGEQQDSQYDFEDAKVIPLYIDSLEKWSKADKIDLEVKYDLDQVKFYYIENKFGKIQYENDSKEGIIKISYSPKELKGDEKLDEKTLLCMIKFKNLNGEMGSESNLTVSGVGTYVNESEKTFNIESSNIGKVIFKSASNVDLTMPVIETDEMSLDVGVDASIKINENGHKLLGVKGFEEGKDYTWDGKFLTLKGSLLKNYVKDYGHNFYLEFEDNIEKVFTVHYLLIEPCINFPYITGESIKVDQGDKFKYNMTLRSTASFSDTNEFNIVYNSDIITVNNIICEDANEGESFKL